MGILAIAVLIFVTISILSSRKLLRWIRGLFVKQKPKDPLQDFSAILHDSRLWSGIEDIMEKLCFHPLGYKNEDFLYGVSTSTYQDSGSKNCPDSQWSDWELKHLHLEERSGSSANLFGLYETDPMEIVNRLKHIGVNSYRFSIEWSHIEPKKGEIDYDKLGVYVNFCKCLRDHDIIPLITLLHFSEPKWFHAMGSFEKEGNIGYFVSFCEVCYKELSVPYKGELLVDHYCTINEPGIEALCRYVLGHFSPGLTYSFKKAGKFLQGILKAHCDVYYHLKELARKDGISVSIGITHQYLRFIPANWMFYPLTKYLSFFNEVVLRFFKQGKFSYHIPLICRIKEVYPNDRKPKVDFAGVQYYGRVHIGFKGAYPPRKEAKTQMDGIHEDSEGLYEAILTTYFAFNAPVVVVTENGISTLCDKQRARYLSRALYAAEEARKVIGEENLLGYFLWSFNDNFEWDKGWEQKFGAYPIDDIGQTASTYKNGVEPYVKTIQAWKQSTLDI